MGKKSKDIKDSGLIFKVSDLDLENLPKIDAHLHTSWTDGEATIMAMQEAAIKSQLTAVLYSEHCRKTSVDWFPSFAAEVRALHTFPCRAYVGAEVKVATHEGELDIAPAIVDLCDFVMASVHRLIDVDGRVIQFGDIDSRVAVDLEYNLTWAALANPQVDIIGHMFGMSYSRYKINPPVDKIRALLLRAAEFRVAVEINAYYHPNLRKMIDWCRECGASITFGSNAHTVESVGAVGRSLMQEVANE